MHWSGKDRLTEPSSPITWFRLPRRGRNALPVEERIECLSLLQTKQLAHPSTSLLLKSWVAPLSSCKHKSVADPRGSSGLIWLPWYQAPTNSHKPRLLAHPRGSQLSQPEMASVAPINPHYHRLLARTSIMPSTTHADFYPSQPQPSLHSTRPLTYPSRAQPSLS